MHQRQCRITVRVQTANKPLYNVHGVCVRLVTWHLLIVCAKGPQRKHNRNPTNWATLCDAWIFCVLSPLPSLNNRPASLAQHALLLLLRCHLMETTTLPWRFHLRSSISCDTSSGVMVRLAGKGTNSPSGSLQTPFSVMWTGASVGCMRCNADGVLPQVREVTALWRSGLVQLCTFLATSASSLPLQCLHPSGSLSLSGPSTWAATFLMLRRQPVKSQVGGVPSPTCSTLARGKFRLSLHQLRSHQPRLDGHLLP